MNFTELMTMASKFADTTTKTVTSWLAWTTVMHLANSQVAGKMVLAVKAALATAQAEVANKDRATM